MNPRSTADGVDELTAADAAVARRTRWFTRPVRRLVNAPHLLVLAIAAVWVACSMLYAVIERKGPVESLWWGIVTGSTVGYGDYYPASTAGRGVASILIVSMLVLVPIAIGHVIANLVLDRNQFTHDEQLALAATIEAVHDRVDRMEHLLAASLAEQHGSDWVRDRLAEFDRREADHTDIDDHMLRLFRSTED